LHGWYRSEIGGLYADGRSTRTGYPVSYASASISLAVLECTLNYGRRGWVPASEDMIAGIYANEERQSVISCGSSCTIRWRSSHDTVSQIANGQTATTIAGLRQTVNNGEQFSSW